MRRFPGLVSLCLLVLCLLCNTVQAANVLIDQAHAQTAGNADWVVDTTDPPSPTSPVSDEDWTGGISAWGVALRKAGHSVQVLNSGTFTYGGAGTKDLSKFDVLITVEPNTDFTATERTAIKSFVQAGGGLFFVADHILSDRNSDGVDSPQIFNNLEAVLGSGMSCPTSGAASNFSGLCSALGTDALVLPILDYDAYRSLPLSATDSVEFFNGTAITLAGNARAIVNSTNGAMMAASTVGSGRVVLFGDSSVPDDGTGATGESLYDGWSQHADRELLLAATDWLIQKKVNLPPQVRYAICDPSCPLSNQAVSVRSRISDFDGVATATLRYCVGSASGPFTDVAMTLVGGDAQSGEWRTSAAIPAQASGTSVYYYVIAGDTGTPTAAGTWPVGAPTSVAKYVVDNASGTPIGSWQLKNTTDNSSYTFPAGTRLRPGQVAIVARNATRSEFEAYWGAALPSDALFYNSGNTFPLIDQVYTAKETFEIIDSSSAVKDGPSVSMSNQTGQPIQRKSINAFQRCSLSTSAGTASAWNVFSRYGATPGYNVPAQVTGANGIRITEMADAPSTAYQFIEIYADTAAGVPVGLSEFSVE